MVKKLPANAGDTRDGGFNPCVEKIPWRRKWQPTPVFLPGESHEQSSLVGYSPRVAKSWTRPSDFTSIFTLLCFMGIDAFYKLKVCCSSMSSDSISAVFATAFAHFMFLHHILVILKICQTFFIIIFDMVIYDQCIFGVTIAKTL